MWSVFRVRVSVEEENLRRTPASQQADGSALPSNRLQMEVSYRRTRYFLNRSSKAWRASFERGGAGAAEPAVCA